jgi:hypothetical protein
MKGFVYAIEAVTLRSIKIGYSNDVESRLRNLQVGSPDKLEIIAAWPGIPDDEYRIHKFLKAWRKHGEWFDPSETVRATIFHCHAKQRTDLKNLELNVLQSIRKIELQAKLQGSCCFCGTPRSEVSQLVASKGNWICEPCIEFCSGALFDRQFKAA